MNNHPIGQDPFSSTDGNSAVGQGTSLVVRQFVAILRGEVAVHEPVNPWRVVAVQAVEKKFCLACFGVRRFDQVVVKSGQVLFTALAVCRCCGAVVE
jgi:hypothetical protein